MNKGNSFIELVPSLWALSTASTTPIVDAATLRTILVGYMPTALSFSIPTTIAYTTAIPFTQALTIITGKTLASNDTLTIAANPVEGSGAQTWLDGNGTNTPVFTNFDYQSGTFDNTNGVRNFITMEYIGGKAMISILNMTAV